MKAILNILHEEGEIVTSTYGFVTGQPLEIEEEPNRLTEIVLEVVGRICVEEDPDELGDSIDELMNAIDEDFDVETVLGPWTITLEIL